MAHALSDEEAGRQILGIFIRNKVQASGTLRRIHFFDVRDGDVQFFSIGTNDLVQYTLAVDRGNANLSSRFTPLHPAVLRLIRDVSAAAHAHKKWVGVCGELAGEPLQPTGRIVVFPNSVVFTGSFFKHPPQEVRHSQVASEPGDLRAQRPAGRAGEDQRIVIGRCHAPPVGEAPR